MQEKMKGCVPYVHIMASNICLLIACSLDDICAAVKSSVSTAKCSSAKALSDSCERSSRFTNSVHEAKCHLFFEIPAVRMSCTLVAVWGMQSLKTMKQQQVKSQ